MGPKGRYVLFVSRTVPPKTRHMQSGVHYTKCVMTGGREHTVWTDLGKKLDGKIPSFGQHKA